MAGTTNFYGISYPTSTDYVKDGAVAIQTVATGFDSAVAIPTYNAQTGTSYTFVLSDTGKVVTASNASTSIYTIPPTASVAWTANTTLRVLNLGAGVVTFAAGAGVTVTNTAQTLTQYQSAQLVRTGLNAWTVTPDSGSASASGLTLISTSAFSGATSQSFGSDASPIFTSTYRNYRIILDNLKVATSSQALTFRLRANTTDLTSAVYDNQTFYAIATSLAGSRTAGGTSAVIASMDTDTRTASYVLDITNPQTTNLKNMVGSGITYAGGDGVRMFHYYNQVNSTVAHNGFTIFASNNISGNISIYGYNI